MLHHYPWHVDALMALADIYVYTGEGSHSAETLEEALLGKAPPRTAIYPGSKKPPPVRS